MVGVIRIGIIKNFRDRSKATTPEVRHGKEAACCKRNRHEPDRKRFYAVIRPLVCIAKCVRCQQKTGLFVFIFVNPNHLANKLLRLVMAIFLIRFFYGKRPIEMLVSCIELRNLPGHSLFAV